MIKRYILILMFFFISDLHTFAHSGSQHIYDMYEILFGNIQFQSTPSFELLRMATTLTLDQYEAGKNQELYDFLSKSGVPNIPAQDVLTYSASFRTHQKYTHLGWNYEYSDKRGNWEQRKKMLVSTVNHVFNFKDKNIKADSFAALLYEIHILGDHIGDTHTTYYTRIRLCSDKCYKGQLISSTSSGSFKNQTLVTYLIYHIERLFREQKHTSEYKALLNFLHSKKDSFIQTEITAANHNVTIKRLAEEIKRELVKYIPILLKREAFFARVFY